MHSACDRFLHDVSKWISRWLNADARTKWCVAITEATAIAAVVIGGGSLRGGEQTAVLFHDAALAEFNLAAAVGRLCGSRGSRTGSCSTPNSAVIT